LLGIHTQRAAKVDFDEEMNMNQFSKKFPEREIQLYYPQTLVSVN